MTQLIIVIVVMLIQQALAYMSSVVLPNMAPLVASAINADPNLVGFHTGIFSFAALALNRITWGRRIPFAVPCGARHLAPRAWLIPWTNPV